MLSRATTLAEQFGMSGENSIADNTSDFHKIDEATMIAGVQRKERWAVAEMIHRYQAKVYAIAYRMSAGDEEQARDLTQEAFIKVLRGIQKFKGESSFYTWLYRIVANTCLDAYRKKRRWRKIFKVESVTDRKGSIVVKDLEAYGDHHPSTDPMAHLAGKQLNREIKSALAQLSNRQRMVFSLKVFEGLSIAEIAQIMNTAKGTVKSHLFRATQHMRKVLSHWATF